MQAGLGGGERTAHPLRGVLRQRDGALQKSCGGGEAAARLRPAGRALELQRDLLVRSRRGSSQMPRSTVRINGTVGDIGQRQMDRAALVRGRRPVHR
jgi:hypothetical protein